jgi:hypothetical protein
MKQSGSAYALVANAAWTFADKYYFYASRNAQSSKQPFKFPSSWR